MELALLSSGYFTKSPDGGTVLAPSLLRLLEGVERGLTSSNSRRAYRTSLLQFLSWCRTQNAKGTFSRLTVLQYKDALIEARAVDPDERLYSAATVNLRLAAVRALAQEAADVDFSTRAGPPRFGAFAVKSRLVHASATGSRKIRSIRS